MHKLMCTFMTPMKKKKIPDRNLDTSCPAGIPCKKRGTAEFFKRLRGVWISDETHFRVFDIASQMINNSWKNSRLKLAKFYGN